MIRFFSIECLVIRFEWFLFFHLGESSSFTDHSGGLFVWKGVMFRYERVILDLTITNQYTLSLNDKTKKWSYGWGVCRKVSHCQVTLWNQLIAGSQKPLSPLKNHVQNLLKGAKHLTDFKWQEIYKYSFRFWISLNPMASDRFSRKIKGISKKKVTCTTCSTFPEQFLEFYNKFSSIFWWV